MCVQYNTKHAYYFKRPSGGAVEVAVEVAVKVAVKGPGEPGARGVKSAAGQG